ncbi:hypothetical protein AVEN_68281-1 [Araneus ventricosus]|uniref:Uncharacterized protein n=1 Tax=Araneus ventricosus TaxID=182803 RepID=A0A4Y2HL97_ARAVE|nr:hypothetical protein AVEN_68281-1 [Araneus ventricosus]
MYDMRCIGKVKCAARTLCAVMNLPPPPAEVQRVSVPRGTFVMQNILGVVTRKVFLKIRESKEEEYEEELVVEILECIGHVLKRMGTRWRNLRNKLKSTKLSD